MSTKIKGIKERLHIIVKYPEFRTIQSASPFTRHFCPFYHQVDFSRNKTTSQSKLSTAFLPEKWTNNKINIPSLEMAAMACN